MPLATLSMRSCTGGIFALGIGQHVGYNSKGVGVQHCHFAFFCDMYPHLYPRFALAVDALTRTNMESRAL